MTVFTTIYFFVRLTNDDAPTYYTHPNKSRISLKSDDFRTFAILSVSLRLYLMEKFKLDINLEKTGIGYKYIILPKNNVTQEEAEELIQKAIGYINHLLEEANKSC